MLNDQTISGKGLEKTTVKFLQQFLSRWDWIYAKSATEKGKAAWRTINGRVQKFAKNNDLSLKLTDEKVLELRRSLDPLSRYCDNLKKQEFRFSLKILNSVQAARNRRLGSDQTFNQRFQKYSCCFTKSTGTDVFMSI